MINRIEVGILTALALGNLKSGGCGHGAGGGAGDAAIPLDEMTLSAFRALSQASFAELEFSHIFTGITEYRVSLWSKAEEFSRAGNLKQKRADSFRNIFPGIVEFVGFLQNTARPN